MRECFFQFWDFVAFSLFFFPPSICPLLKNSCPVVCASFRVFVFTSASTKRAAMIATKTRQQINVRLLCNVLPDHKKGIMSSLAVDYQNCPPLRKKCPLSANWGSVILPFNDTKENCIITKAVSSIDLILQWGMKRNDFLAWKI